MSRWISWCYDRFARGSELACLGDWRAELLGDLSGAVLEIGAGTGANLGHYGPHVERLVLLEPDRFMRKRLVPRLEDHSQAELRDDSAEQLPDPDESFDAVVSTLVLCSVDSPATVLAELFRVLKPGGRLAFIEHVAAHDRPERLKWQRRLEPIWKRIADNCHVTRDTAAAIEAAGFRFESLIRESIRKANPLVRPSIRGWALKPA